MSNVPLEWLIVADDLTGAADAAAHFASSRETQILLAPESEWPSAAVLAIDTDTRHVPPAQAARVVTQAVGVGRLRPGVRVVKKIDSLLRGNVGAEVRAARDALASRREAPMILAAPALPAQGRLTREGRVVSSSSGGGADVRAALTAAGLRTPAPVPVSAVRAGRAGAELAAARVAGFDAVVIDAEQDDDLRAVAALVAADPSILAVASSGLCARLAEIAPSKTARDAAPSRAGSILFVVGSRTPAARAQAAALVASGAAEETISSRASAAEAAVAADRLAALVGVGDAIAALDAAEEVDLSRAAEAAALLAAVAAPAARAVATIVATGGETARALLAELGISRLRVAGERAPGIVALRADGLDADLLTKSGSFGGADALVRLRSGSTPAVPPPESGDR